MHEDIMVENHGSVFLLRPLSDEGRQWLNEHLPADRIMFGGSTMVETRFVADIVMAAIHDGLSVI